MASTSRTAACEENDAKSSTTTSAARAPKPQREYCSPQAKKPAGSFAQCSFAQLSSVVCEKAGRARSDSPQLRVDWGRDSGGRGAILRRALTESFWIFIQF